MNALIRWILLAAIACEILVSYNSTMGTNLFGTTHSILNAVNDVTLSYLEQASSATASVEEEEVEEEVEGEGPIPISSTTLREKQTIAAPQKAKHVSSRNINRNHTNGSTTTRMNHWQEPIGKLYICGYTGGVPERFAILFPYHQHIPLMGREDVPELNVTSSSRSSAGPNDVFLFLGKRASPGCRAGWFAPYQNHRGYLADFPGKVLFTNPESSNPAAPELARNNDHVYEIGFLQDASKRQMRVSFLQLTLLSFGPAAWQRIFIHSQKAVSSKRRFMIYATSNCVDFREQAAYTLAQAIHTIDQGGKCSGLQQASQYPPKKQPPPPTTRRELFQPVPKEFQNLSATGVSSWIDNPKLFHEYRFCLVLEHSIVAGYMTEKPLMAFLGGCIPIYYGTEEIFDIFNPKAFVFYNISNATAAVERIRTLETDEAAYQEVMDQPILAHGQETIEKYFSLTNQIGHGGLMKRIHSMMGLPVPS